MMCFQKPRFSAENDRHYRAPYFPLYKRARTYQSEIETLSSLSFWRLRPPSSRGRAIASDGPRGLRVLFRLPFVLALPCLPPIKIDWPQCSC
jgi:hypothetical protein